MHFQRKLKKALLHSSAGGECDDEAETPPPAPVTNPTGIYLESASLSTFTTNLGNGTRGTKGSAFFDRLLPATPLPSVDKRSRGNRVAAHTPVLPNQSFTNSTTLDCSPVSLLDVPSSYDDDDQLSSNTITSSVSRTGTEATSYVSASIKGGDDAHDHMELFFEQMRQNLREMRRVNITELYHAEMARKAQEAAEGTSAEALNPLIRIDHKKRTAVDECFKTLQVPEKFDTVRADAFRHIELRERKYQHNVGLIIEPAKGLLEAVWDQHRVPQPTRRDFAEKYFVPDPKSYEAISNELKRYHNVPGAEVELIRLVGLRETHKANLKALVTSPLLSGGGSQAHGHNISRAEGLAMDIYNTILQLRHVTCSIVDIVQQQRETFGDSVAPPLMWNSRNYIVDMQTDLDFLQTTKLSALLCKAYVLAKNPLLLPVELHDKSKWMAEKVEKKEVPLREALQRSNSAMSSSTTVATPGLGNSSGSRPVSVQSDARAGGIRGLEAEYRRQQSIIVARDGEEIPVVRRSSTPQVNSSGSSKKANDPYGGLSREQFFAKLEKDERLRNQRIPMDRSNVYQYPASVYKPAPVSFWESLGSMLQRSLDPRLETKPYDDVIEYERMQFGRLTSPPSFAAPWSDPVLDHVNHCFRTVLSNLPTYHYEDLVRREILIFAEDCIVRNSSAKRKFHRALDKLRMAHRGFISTMQRRREALAPGGSAKQFLAWVEHFAPQWLSDAKRQLKEADEEEALLGMLNDD